MNFCLGSFSVRGCTEKSKKEELVRDISRHHLDISCVQETKSNMLSSKKLKVTQL